MSISVTREVAVITGASQGIGAWLVRGYRVVANSRSTDPSASDDLLAVGGDISDPGVADRVIAGEVEAFGPVDTLVNNAGICISKAFTDDTEADFVRETSVILSGFFHVIQHAVRRMLTQWAATSFT